MKDNEQILKEEMKELRKIPDIKGSAVIRRDGLMIISDLPGNVNSNSVAAMTAAIVGTSETASRELKTGEMIYVTIESTSGALISIGAGSDAILVAITKRKPNINRVLGEMNKTSKKVAKLI
jgi:predicted regulator of Ras-like GTPase activity (Roadblock/LC7/MglB family)